MADEFTKAALYWIKTFNRKVKEKIWMEKLIELLNEYEQEEWCWRLKYWKLHNKYYDDYDRKDEEIRLISKWYGFIKWLVENDKIDREKFYDKARDIISDFDLKWKYEWASNEVIMILSISDTPIEDLISYLK